MKITFTVDLENESDVRRALAVLSAEGTKEQNKYSPKIQAAVEFIEKSLSGGGPKSSKDIHNEAKNLTDIKPSTLEDAARYLRKEGVLKMRKQTNSSGKTQWNWIARG
jgi:hypothetical protein